MKNLVLLVAVLISMNSAGQETVFGDSTVVATIKKTTSKIYTTKDKTNFFLTKKPLRQIKTYGTDITAYSNKGAVNRIIAKSMVKKGQLSTEWYFSNSKLIYVYESFESFNENDDEKGWKNFKGLRAWESRYYFVNQSIKFQKHKGKKNIHKENEAMSVLKDGNAILGYVDQNKNR